jgi:hypothetical protein
VFFNRNTKISHPLYNDYMTVDSKINSITGFVDRSEGSNASFYLWNRVTGRMNNIELKQRLNDDTKVGLESLELRTQAAETKVAERYEFSNRYFHGLGLFLYPDSYYKMKAAKNDPIEQVIKLFTDYSSYQFIRGHFNRHHTATAKYIVKELKALQESNMTFEERIKLARSLLLKTQNDFICVGVLTEDDKALNKSSFYRRLNFALDKMLTNVVAPQVNAQLSL